MKTSDSPTSLRSGYKYEEWAEQLRSRIERGELKPGDKLPSHAEMYAQHGLSRPVVEKVHSILEQDGLIERQPRRGAFVKAPTVSATDVIGFYCPSLRHYAGHPYYVRLLTAMSAEAHRVGLDLLLLNSDMAKQNWQKVGGVLLYKPDEILLEEQLDALPPSIARVSLLIGSPNATSVVADDYHGSKSATEHLLGLGHQRVAYLGLNEFRIMRERRNGFCDALRAANIAAGADSMRELNVEDVRSQGYMFAGRRAVENWLGDGWDGALTGIVAQNDDVAIGAIEALQSAGLARARRHQRHRLRRNRNRRLFSSPPDHDARAVARNRRARRATAATAAQPHARRPANGTRNDGVADFSRARRLDGATAQCDLAKTCHVTTNP